MLLSHLRRVEASHGKNKMTVQNLGVCFGPTLMREKQVKIRAIVGKFENDTDVSACLLLLLPLSALPFPDVVITTPCNYACLVTSTAFLPRAIRPDVSLLLSGWTLGIVFKFYNSYAKDFIIILFAGSAI